MDSFLTVSRNVFLDVVLFPGAFVSLNTASCPACGFDEMLRWKQRQQQQQ